jgi:hypothetical protein
MSVIGTDIRTVQSTDSRVVHSRFARTPLWRVGALSGVVAAITAELFAQICKAFDVSMRAGSAGASTAEPIPFGGFAIATLMWAAVGIVLAIALARWAKHPSRTFVVTTVALTVLSFAAPITAGATDTSTKIVLAVSHVVAAAVIIPALALRLAHNER